MFSKTARPSSTASTMLAKLSSRRTRSDASRATSVPGDAHRDADVGSSQRRRVVHAVAGDRHDAALALERRHDAQLLIGGDPRADDLGGIQRQLELRIGHPARSSPVSSVGAALCTSPISRATATAVCGWSPVTMTILMPASRHRRTAAGTSARGGSSKPTRAVTTRSCSASAST